MQESLTLANWALVGATAVLAILTGWYAWWTRGIVQRMDEEREQMSRPLLAFLLVPWQAGVLKLRIQNLGSGPALDIDGVIETRLQTGGSVPVNWSYPVLASQKYEEFGFPMPKDVGDEARFKLDKIRKHVVSVRADFSYSSASGRHYHLTQAIDVTSVTDDWIASRMMATQDHPDRLLPRIAKALEDLVKRP